MKPLSRFHVSTKTGGNVVLAIPIFKAVSFSRFYNSLLVQIICSGHRSPIFLKV